MRLVATSDTHYPPYTLRQNKNLEWVKDWNVEIPDGDVFIHAGDIMRTGYPREWDGVLEWLSCLPHKHKYYIPGNHDFHMIHYPGPALQELREIGVTCVGLPGNDNWVTVKLPNGMKMLGLPFISGNNRWAFNLSEDEIHAYLARVYDSVRDPVDIVVSHCPVKGMLDETDTRDNAGIHAYSVMLSKSKNPPKHWICGHIHEAWGVGWSDIYPGTKCYNVSMCNRDYKQVNKPTVIDIK